jgi:hypothetical protein
MGNERADEAAKNTLEEDINDRELYSPQDLTNWLKKTDARNRQKRWAQREKTMRFRKETIEWKDDSTNLIRKEQVVVSRLRTGIYGIYEFFQEWTAAKKPPRQ